jgi:hypothetical protein
MEGTMMKPTRKLLMVALAAGFAAAAAAANAQPFGANGSGCPGAYGAGPGMMGWGGGPGMGPRGGGPGAGPGWMGPRGGGPAFNPASNAEARLAYLKSELRITADQETAWNTYSAAVKQQAADMQTFRNAMFTAQTAQDRITLHAEHAKQRAAAFENLDKGLHELYAVLTPEQKSQADLHLGHMRFSQAGPRGRW